MEILMNQLTAEDFNRLFRSIGWREPSLKVAQKALDHSYATFSVVEKGRTIAMARLLGDGAMSFYLKTLVVEPEYQGKGIGARLVRYIEEYIHGEIEDDTRVCFELMCSAGKEGFYEKLGYEQTPTWLYGAGMLKMIEK